MWIIWLDPPKASFNLSHTSHPNQSSMIESTIYVAFKFDRYAGRFRQRRDGSYISIADDLFIELNTVWVFLHVTSVWCATGSHNQWSVIRWKYLRSDTYRPSLIYPTSMMTSWNWNIFCVTGLLRREFTGRRWFPHTKVSCAQLWCFLSSSPE